MYVHCVAECSIQTTTVLYVNWRNCDNGRCNLPFIKLLTYITQKRGVVLTTHTPLEPR
jgi:hypothetical protein